MIKESVKVHGQHQFEVKQNVSFAKQDQVIRYQIDTYFFLPAALQINQDSYPAKTFQNILKNYVRLRPPTRQLANLAAADGEIEMLRNRLAAFAREENPSVAQYENTLKRYALTYKRALRLASKKILYQNSQNANAIQRAMDDVTQSLTAYRALAEMTATIESKVASNAFAYCDEYLSLVTTDNLRKLALQLDLPMQEAIQQVLRNEAQYRKAYHPDSVLDSGNNNEQVLYRWTLLRKYVSSYLFLDIRRKNAAPLLLHSLYGVAAAVSMIFATLVAFFWQERYGSLSTNLFLALVIAYIFKDRIKEVGREQLYRLFRKWIPDRKLLIYRGENTIVGICKESFQFMPTANLPEDIRTLREQAHWIPLLNDPRAEDILRYKKEVELRNHPELFETTQYSITDITRFNLIDFVRQIDNMFEELPLNGGEEHAALGERIYHIYMIRQIVFQGQTANELVRLVVNAQGIKRLEIIQPLQFPQAPSLPSADTPFP